MSSIRTRARRFVLGVVAAAGCRRSAPIPPPVAPLAGLGASVDSAALAAGTGALLVRVTSATKAAPVEQAQLRMYRPVPGVKPPRDTLLLFALGDRDGWAQLRGPAGPYRLVAGRIGFVRYETRVELRAGHTDTLLLRLRDTTVALGWVSPAWLSNRDDG